MHSYSQTILIIRLLFCVIILLKVVSGEGYDNFSEEENFRFPVSVKRVRGFEARELFGKRSNQFGSSPSIFGRNTRRGRELFGKRSFPITSFWSLPEDQGFSGFYSKRTRARELLGKRSEIVNENNNFYDDLLQNEKRRARELLGKRNSYESFQIVPQYVDTSDDSYNLKPQFGKFIEIKRGRTRELFGR